LGLICEAHLQFAPEDIGNRLVATTLADGVGEPVPEPESPEVVGEAAGDHLVVHSGGVESPRVDGLTQLVIRRDVGLVQPPPEEEALSALIEVVEGRTQAAERGEVVLCLDGRIQTASGIVAAIPIAQVAGEVEPESQITNLPCVAQEKPPECTCPAAPVPLAVGRLPVQTTIKTEPRVRRIGERFRDDVDDTPQRTCAVECRAGNLDHLDPVHLSRGNGLVVDLTGIPRHERDAVHEHENPASGPPAVSAGSTDADLELGHVHAGDIAKGIVNRNRIAEFDPGSIQHRYTHG
jgi:hypothetical protein